MARKTNASAPKDGLRPIHPGEILREELDEIALSANTFAKALGVPTNRITAILNKQRGLTADTALRLQRYFGTSARFWLNLQQNYDLKIAERAAGKMIVRRITPRRTAA